MRSDQSPWFRATESPNVEARIYNDKQLVPYQSIEKGERIYKDVTFIEIRIKGSPDLVTRPIQNPDIERFPDAWRYFKGEEVVFKTGTPIEDLHGIESELATKLRARGILYIEDFVRLQPEMITGLGMSVGEMQKKARLMLGYKEPEEMVSDVKKETGELAGRINTLEQILFNMQSQIALLVEAKTSDSAKPQKKAKAKPNQEIEEAA